MPVSMLEGADPGPFSRTVSAYQDPPKKSGWQIPVAPALMGKEPSRLHPVAPSGHVPQEAWLTYRLTPWTGLGTPFRIRPAYVSGFSHVGPTAPIVTHTQHEQTGAG